MFNKVKKSHGIACCRWNINKQQYEWLMVKKKYTYYFVHFMFGYYNINYENQIKYVLNRISTQEKYLILSRDFGKMWYHVWGVDPERTPIEPKNLKLYTKYKKKFNDQIPSWRFPDLERLIYRSTNADLLWELPKGRREPGEQPLNCAIREFEEETGITYDQYRVLFSMGCKSYHVIDLNVKYVFRYYVAVFSRGSIKDLTIQPRKQPINYCSEICDIKWMSLDQIKDINNNIYVFVNNLQKQLKPYQIPQQTEL